MLKEKIQIAAGAVIIFLAVLSFAVYQGWKEFDEVGELRQKDTAVEIQLAELKEELGGAEDFFKKYEALKSDLEKYLFKDQDIPAFLDGMANIARKEKIDITRMKTRSFSPVQARPVQDTTAPLSGTAQLRSSRQREASGVQEEETSDTIVLASLPVDMNTTGTFVDFLRFLKEVEQFEQLLTVSDINISRGVYPELRYSFSIDIYSMTSIGALSK